MLPKWQVCLAVGGEARPPVRRPYGGRLDAIYFDARSLGVSDPRFLAIEGASASQLLIVRPTCVSPNSSVAVNQVSAE